MMIQSASKPLKRPVSVLILLHDQTGQVLLLERADRKNFWQSVTGSVELGETPMQAAYREVAEETGIVLPAGSLHDWQHQVEYEIFAHWRHRYPDGITHNTEHWFSAAIDRNTPITLSEHTAQQWLPAPLAAQRVFSPSNRDIIEQWFQQMQAA